MRQFITFFLLLILIVFNIILAKQSSLLSEHLHDTQQRLTDTKKSLDECLVAKKQ